MCTCLYAVHVCVCVVFVIVCVHMFVCCACVCVVFVIVCVIVSCACKHNTGIQVGKNRGTYILCQTAFLFLLQTCLERNPNAFKPKVEQSRGNSVRNENDSVLCDMIVCKE